ncbi:MAG: hypothetical protein AAFP84_01335 [Actinomycetota bacterium]
MPLEQLAEHLDLMTALQRDDVAIWNAFGIQPDHLMVDGLPHILIWVDDADGRCPEILEVVDHPELIRLVEWAEGDHARLDPRISPPWRELIRADLERSASERGHARSAATGGGLNGVVHVWLEHEGEAFAAELVDAYGPLIRVSIGNFEYDPDLDTVVGEARCTTLPAETARSGLTVTAVRLEGTSRHRRMMFEVTNTSATTVHLVPDRIAELTVVGGERTLTAFAGMMTDEARESVAVASGATTTIETQLSTDVCDPTDGAQLPPGSYQATVVVRVFDVEAYEGDPSDDALVVRLDIELPDVIGVLAE